MSCPDIAPRVRLARSVACLAVAATLALVASGASAQSVDWARTTPPGPIARIENGMVSCGGRMVLFGGHDLNFNRLNDLWEYDTLTATWHQH
jgi:hypothetical protein